MDARYSLAARTEVFFKTKLNMADDDSYSTTTSVSDEEGHSTILMAHTRIFTRLILIY